MEHRWGDRVRSDVAVKVFGSPASIGWGRIRDMSISGGFIETQLRLEPLSTLRITVAFDPRTGSEREVVRAVVVRRDAQGVGVEWFDGDWETIARLLQEARAGLAVVSAASTAPVWLAR